MTSEDATVSATEATNATWCGKTLECEDHDYCCYFTEDFGFCSHEKHYEHCYYQRYDIWKQSFIYEILGGVVAFIICVGFAGLKLYMLKRHRRNHPQDHGAPMTAPLGGNSHVPSPPNMRTYPGTPPPPPPPMGTYPGAPPIGVYPGTQPPPPPPPGQYGIQPPGQFQTQYGMLGSTR